jgi:hypothetical protein
VTGKNKQSPIGQQFVPLPRDLLRSDAWRSMSINERRLVDFLMLEHMRHGGRQNGNLKAPRQQLHAFGIGSHFASMAIAAAEERGLILCNRGGMRVATTYGLTWLATAGGRTPSNAWMAYSDPSLKPMPEPKSRNLGAKQQSGLGAKQQSDGPNLGAKQQSDGPKSLGAKQQHPYRSTLPGKLDTHSVLGGGSPAVVSLRSAKAGVA